VIKIVYLRATLLYQELAKEKRHDPSPERWGPSVSTASIEAWVGEYHLSPLSVGRLSPCPCHAPVSTG
jgi:hypothetical protein